MAITATDVNKLRQITGAGMMDCKKALEEASGDFDGAIEVLRKKGQKVSEKRADRDAKEGAVLAQVFDGGKQAVMLEFNCETDFVARNDDFQGLGQMILTAAATHAPGSAEALLALQVDGRAISEHLTDAIGRIGEKLDVSKYVHLAAEQVVAYIHPGARIGVLVAFDKVGGKDVADVGRDVAMQVASMDPVALDKSDVDPTIIQKEIEIGKEQARQEGKPEQILEKIALGKLERFYKDRTLLQQEFVKDSSKTVSQRVAEVSPDLKVVAFRRMALGN